MKLILAESKYFKDSVSIISDLVSEAKLKVTPDGLELVAMDPANVAMVVFKLLSSSFTVYEVQETTELTLNLQNLKQILRRADQNDVVSLETTEDQKLKVTLKGATTRSFSLPLLDAEEKEQKVPQLNFPLTVTMDASLFAQAVEDVSVVAESVTFLGEKEKLSVKAEGDLSKAFIEIGQSENTSIVMNGVEKAKAKYSLEYLKKMISGGKLHNQVKVSFNNDYPLKLEYVLTDRLYLSFILAPRVDND